MLLDSIFRLLLAWVLFFFAHIPPVHSLLTTLCEVSLFGLHYLGYLRPVLWWILGRSNPHGRRLWCSRDHCTDDNCGLILPT